VWVGTPGHTGAPAFDPTDERGVQTDHGRTSEALPKESGGNRYAST
jgi:hypothetical protein